MAAIAGFAVAVAVLQLWRASLRVPFLYESDALFHGVLAQMVNEGGSWVHSSRLGAPVGLAMWDFPIGVNLLQIGVVGILGKLSGSPFAAMNIYLVLTYPLVAVAACWASRRLGLSNMASLMVAVLFTGLPFHQVRGELHLFLSMYAQVPIVVWMAVAAAQGRPLLNSRSSQAGWRRWVTGGNLGVLALAAAVGFSSLYWTAFGAVLIVAGLVLGIWAESAASRERLLRGAVVLAALLGPLILDTLPTFVYAEQHGTNASMTRAASDSERFALKPVSLVLPTDGHRIPGASALGRRYRRDFPLPPEGGAYVGLVAAAGLAGLLLLVLARTARRGAPERAEPRTEPAGPELLGPCAGLALVGLLLATTGGGAALLALVGLTEVRAWNRMSVVLAFLGLLAAGSAFDRLTTGHRFHRFRWPRGSAVALLAVVVIVGLLDQSIPGRVPDYAGLRAQVSADADFVAALERVLPAGAMVFQLPYLPFPEGEPDPAGTMGPYDPARGFLHSRRLRWSYGGQRGRPGDWPIALTDKPTADVLDRVAAVGFAAVWIDGHGYPDSGSAMEAEVVRLTGPPVLTSRDGRFFVHDLSPTRRVLSDRLGEAGVARLARTTLAGPALVAGEGFYAEESADHLRWRWARNDARLNIVSFADHPVRVRLTATVDIRQPEARLTIQEPTGRGRPRRSVLDVSAGGTPLILEITVGPGTTTIRFTSDVGRHTPAGDPRDLRFRLVGLDLVNLEAK